MCFTKHKMCKELVLGLVLDLGFVVGNNSNHCDGGHPRWRPGTMFYTSWFGSRLRNFGRCAVSLKWVQNSKYLLENYTQSII